MGYTIFSDNIVCDLVSEVEGAATDTLSEILVCRETNRTYRKQMVDGVLKWRTPNLMSADDYGGSDSNTVRNSDRLNGQLASYYATYVQADNALAQAILAKSDAATAQTAANTAASTASGAQTSANTAQATANSALSAANAKQDPITVSLPLTKTVNNLAINNATTSTAGAMSAADKTKLDGLQTVPDQMRMGTTATFNILGLGSVDYPVIWDTPFVQLPGKTVAQTVAAIQIKRFFNGTNLTLLGNLTVTEKAGTRSLTGVTFTVSNSGLSLVNTGNLDVISLLSGQA